MKEEKRFLRLVDVADRGRGIAALIQAPEVDDFFRAYERECMELIADANADDDDTRREAGLRLKAMRTFEKEMRSAVESGKRASKKIEELRNE